VLVDAGSAAHRPPRVAGLKPDSGVDPPVLQQLPVPLPAAGAAVAALVLVALGGYALARGDEKYDDPEAQAAHEAAQARDESEAAPVGSVHEAVVTETDESTQGREAVVRVRGLVVFVDHEVPASVATGDTIRLKVTSHSENAAHATFLAALD
jgi:predicted RNA-binding protein with TRAM domain